MDTTKNVNIAIIGCGTVGGSVAEILIRDRIFLTARNGININLKYIVDVDFSYAESIGLDSTLFEKDINKVLEDSSVSIFIELIGGTTIAKTVTEKVLNTGRHIITANKALLAYHGVELIALARKNNVSISFEASCGGGIPIIRALTEGLSANSIEAFYGIVNGTCNYILTSMINNGKQYDEALQRAQEKGLAEADPTLDISGGDSAHKLCIMASLAFGVQVDFNSIKYEGINNLSLEDVRFGQELGYTVKLLAIAQKIDSKLSLRVQPAFLHNNHPLAWVSGPFNAVSVYGSCVGHTMYYGRGAGGSPTASAIIADVISTANGINPALFNTLNIWPDKNKTAELIPAAQIASRYYLRVVVKDQPGVLASVTGILSNHGISITSALQKEPETGRNTVSVVITTHTASAGEIETALKEFASLSTIQNTICIPIIDEHEENI